jgi:hypothetical protein
LNKKQREPSHAEKVIVDCSIEVQYCTNRIVITKRTTPRILTWSPIWYKLGPIKLNFAEQTGSGAVIMVWSFLFEEREKMPIMQKHKELSRITSTHDDAVATSYLYLYLVLSQVYCSAATACWLLWASDTNYWRS